MSPTCLCTGVCVHGRAHAHTWKWATELEVSIKLGSDLVSLVYSNQLNSVFWKSSLRCLK